MAGLSQKWSEEIATRYTRFGSPFAADYNSCPVLTPNSKIHAGDHSLAASASHLIVRLELKESYFLEKRPTAHG
jgi:hypothetical protein